MNRRAFIQTLGLLGFAPLLPSCLSSRPEILYPAADFGNVTLFHLTDCHAQLLPVYYREPSSHPGSGNKAKQPPNLAGEEFLNFFGIRPNSKEAYAFTHLNFAEAARTYGKMGGFAHLATLVKQIKRESRHGNFLVLDGGDTWQGSATALWTQGRDMVEACNLLGVEVMTGHWEFTYGAKTVLENLKAFKAEFVAQNIALTEEAQFAAGTENDTVFKPYVIKEYDHARIAVIGQAYPYTPIANPAYLVPDWQFGIQAQRLQQIVAEIRRNKSADAIILLSHNGMDIDLKLASVVCGIDLILGGHSHDVVPRPVWISNADGRTCVTNGGSHGKFLAVVDLDIRNHRLVDLRYRLLPVFADLLEPDADMQRLIGQYRQPYLSRLGKPLAVTDKLLYRRDTYHGTFDEILLQALLKTGDAEIALSPGFRWGTTLLPGQIMTYEDVMNHCAISYPAVVRRNLTGAEIKAVLEDAADNIFNPDPYYRQGGDMVRVGGLRFRCDPAGDTGRRISELRLTSGDSLAPNKAYRVASWASVKQEVGGRAMADVLVDYLVNHG